MADSITVELTNGELTYAYQVGAVRVANHIPRRFVPVDSIRDRVPWVQRFLYTHIQHAVGECVLSKYLGLSWEPEQGRGGHFRGGYVHGYYVRMTSHHGRDLWAFSSDPDEAVLVLISGHINQLRFRLHGWAVAKEAKCDYFAVAERDDVDRDDVMYHLPDYFLSSMGSLSSSGDSNVGNPPT